MSVDDVMLRQTAGRTAVDRIYSITIGAAGVPARIHSASMDSAVCCLIHHHTLSCHRRSNS